MSQSTQEVSQVSISSGSGGSGANEGEVSQNERRRSLADEEAGSPGGGEVPTFSNSDQGDLALRAAVEDDEAAEAVRPRPEANLLGLKRPQLDEYQPSLPLSSSSLSSRSSLDSEDLYYQGNQGEQSDYENENPEPPSKRKKIFFGNELDSRCSFQLETGQSEQESNRLYSEENKSSSEADQNSIDRTRPTVLPEARVKPTFFDASTLEPEEASRRPDVQAPGTEFLQQNPGEEVGFHKEPKGCEGALVKDEDDSEDDEMTEEDILDYLRNELKKNPPPQSRQQIVRAIQEISLKQRARLALEDQQKRAEEMELEERLRKGASEAMKKCKGKVQDCSSPTNREPLTKSPLRYYEPAISAEAAAAHGSNTDQESLAKDSTIRNRPAHEPLSPHDNQASGTNSGLKADDDDLEHRLFEYNPTEVDYCSQRRVPPEGLSMEEKVRNMVGFDRSIFPNHRQRRCNPQYGLDKLKHIFNFLDMLSRNLGVDQKKQFHQNPLAYLKTDSPEDLEKYLQKNDWFRGMIETYALFRDVLSHGLMADVSEKQSRIYQMAWRMEGVEQRIGYIEDALGFLIKGMRKLEKPAGSHMGYGVGFSNDLQGKNAHAPLPATLHQTKLSSHQLASGIIIHPPKGKPNSNRFQYTRPRPQKKRS